MSNYFDTILELPEGYDEKTRLVLVNTKKAGKHGLLIATHPQKTPLLIDMDAGTIEDMGVA